MKPLTFAIDLDGVLADTHAEILKRYNRDWNDTLTAADIKYWDMALIVKPECGKKIYDYFKQEDLYGYIQPMRGAKEAVDLIRETGHEVIVATSCFLGTEYNKLMWLMNYEFVRTHNDVIITERKDLIKADVLIDDKPDHLEKFGEMTVAFDHPYNIHVKTTHRITGWHEDILESLKAKDWLNYD